MKKKNIVVTFAIVALLTSVPIVNADAAGTKTMYVLSTYEGDRLQADYQSQDNPYIIGTEIDRRKYTYDENGLLKTRTDGFTTNEFLYDGVVVDRVKTTYKSDSSEFTYDKKGRLQEKNFGSSSAKEVFSYYKSKLSGKYEMGDGESAHSWGYLFDSNGRITDVSDVYVCKADGNDYKDGGFALTFEYDSNGRLSRSVTTVKNACYLTCQNRYDDEDIIFEYEYTDGRVTKIHVTSVDWKDHWTRNLSYKKIQVPKKYVKAVKEQQRRILWNDIILAVTDLGYYGETLNPID